MSRGPHHLNDFKWRRISIWLSAMTERIGAEQINQGSIPTENYAPHICTAQTNQYKLEGKSHRTGKFFLKPYLTLNNE